MEDYVTVATVQAAAKELGIVLDDTEADIMARCLLRGAKIDEKKFGSVDVSSGFTSVLAPRVPGGKAFLHKVSTPGGTPGPSATNTPDPSAHGSEMYFGVAGQANSKSVI